MQESEYFDCNHLKTHIRTDNSAFGRPFDGILSSEKTSFSQTSSPYQPYHLVKENSNIANIITNKR